MKVRKMRLLRLKSGVLRRDLGELWGLSPQRISEIELNPAPEVSDDTQRRLKSAFKMLIEQRQKQMDDLRHDYMDMESSLLEGVEETTYEL